MRELLRNSDCYLLNKDGFMFKIDGGGSGRLDIPERGYVVEVTSLVVGDEGIDDVISAMLFLMDNPTVEIEECLYELCIGGYFNEVEGNYVIELYALVSDKYEATGLGRITNKNTIYCIDEEKLIVI